MKVLIYVGLALGVSSCLATDRDVLDARKEITDTVTEGHDMLAAQHLKMAQEDIEGLQKQVERLFQASADNRRQSDKALADAQSGVEVAKEMIRNGVIIADWVSGRDLSSKLKPFLDEAEYQSREAVKGEIDRVNAKILEDSRKLEETRAAAAKTESEFKAVQSKALAEIGMQADKIAMVRKKLEGLDEDTRQAVRDSVSREEFTALVNDGAKTADEVRGQIEKALTRSGASQAAIDNFKQESQGMGKAELLALIAAILGGGAGTIGARMGPSRGKEDVRDVKAELAAEKAKIEALVQAERLRQS